MEKLPVIELLIPIFSFLLIDLLCHSNALMVDCLASDRDALMDFKSGLQDPENLLSSWRGRNCCQWWGISCDKNTGGVVGIDLHNPHPIFWYDDSSSRYGFWDLSGEIKPSLMKLKSLRHLDLSFNTFNGIPIPGFFGSLEKLRYLNLSNAGFSGTIPLNLGNLSHLKVLDLGFLSLDVENLQWVTGLVSLERLAMSGIDLSLVTNWVGALNQLPSIVELHLSSCNLFGFPSPTSLNFTSLAVIDFSGNNFNSMIPNWLVNISSLQYIDMSRSYLYGRIPLGFGELPYLKSLDLSLNDNLTASCPQLFRGRWEKLEVLDLGSKKLHGKLPSSLGNMTALRYLNLFDNAIEGGIPSSIGKLCNLKFFGLSGNNLTGSLPKFLEGGESCSTRNPLPNLKQLDLSNNKLVGNIPDWLGQLGNLDYNLLEGPIPTSLGSLQNLTSLTLAGNKLNGTLPYSLGQLSALSLYDVSSNRLTGAVSEGHFLKLTKLKILHLSYNSFTMNVSSNWIPPFQVRNLDMGSCTLGPLFPAWVKSQKQLMFLDLSNASISGYIPNWFWDISSKLSLLNISHNELQGQFSNPLPVAPFADVDLSFNLFEGPLPLTTVGIELLDLSHNHFSGPIPQNISESMPYLTFLSLSNNHLSGEIPMAIGVMSSLIVIDISSNNFTGRIPSSLANCSFLNALDLGRNSLYGTIPNSMGQLQQLRTLHLSNNKFSGKLPSSFTNLSNLETMDLGNNQLSGEIPTWIGDGFSYLRILNLRSNAFSGIIPSNLSKLSSLQVLDLGDNDLSGSIPATLGYLRAMAKEHKINTYLLYGKYRGVSYEESLVVNTKGQSLEYTKTLSLVTSIDLSRNNLSGRFPQEITKLTSLVVLNLSGNHITSNIPRSISNMHQLSSLDLSNNQLSGTIPPSLSSLSFLGYLNLSSNNLSGAIPYTGHMTTFDSSSFTGNPTLCGLPLPLKCPGDDSNKVSSNDETDDDGFINKWFYLSLGLGFAMGVLVPYFILAIKRSWSDAYFEIVDRVLYRFVVHIHRRRINHGRKNKPHHRR